jgi:hypothetical protein
MATHHLLGGARDRSWFQSRLRSVWHRRIVTVSSTEVARGRSASWGGAGPIAVRIRSGEPQRGSLVLPIEGQPGVGH